MKKYILFSCFFLISCNFFTKTQPQVPLESAQTETTHQEEQVMFQPIKETRFFLMKWPPNENTWAVEDYFIAQNITLIETTPSTPKNNATMALETLFSMNKLDYEWMGYNPFFSSRLKLRSIDVSDQMVRVSLDWEYKVVWNFTKYGPVLVNKILNQYFEKYEIYLNGSSDEWLCKSKIDIWKCK